MTTGQWTIPIPVSVPVLCPKSFQAESTFVTIPLPGGQRHLFIPVTGPVTHFLHHSSLSLIYLGPLIFPEASWSLACSQSILWATQTHTVCGSPEVEHRSGNSHRTHTASGGHHNDRQSIKAGNRQIEGDKWDSGCLLRPSETLELCGD